MAITDKDINKLKEVFATKDDLKKFATNEELRGSIKGLRVEIGEKIDESAKEVKREILGGLDKVMGELAKIRDEQTCAIGKDREQDRRLDELDSRVKKVEVKIG